MNIRDVQRTVDDALFAAGFYDREQIDGLRYQTIPAAIERAQKELGLPLTVEQDWGFEGCLLSAPGVKGYVEVQACRYLDQRGPGGSYRDNPDFGAVHTGGDTAA